MENQEKIYNQIITVAKKAETGDFAAMENVWSRVESKLDKKVLKKENHLWKKIAVAASLLLIVSVVYQFNKTDVLPQKNNNPVVVKETIPESEIQNNTAVTAISKKEKVTLTKNAEKILKDEIKTDQTVAAIQETEPVTAAAPLQKPEIKGEISAKVNAYNTASANNNGYFYKGRIFDAIGVHHSIEKNQGTDDEAEKKQENVVLAKKTPLVVIDGKAITYEKDANPISEKAKLARLQEDDLEEVVMLNEPLYIINGVEYSEESLFGENPTSPYYPLDRQEIETISILKDKKILALYGEKGKKGVVIITTKKAKPLLKN
jgi:TonB-dependent SusC/RagA subfamily outer membrane receptor